MSLFNIYRVKGRKKSKPKPSCCVGSLKNVWRMKGRNVPKKSETHIYGSGSLV